MNVELLAPAGSFESLKTALYFGADAVYCGGPLLQLRASGAGFSFDELREAVKYTHERNKKIFVTVNCFAENEEHVDEGNGLPVCSSGSKEQLQQHGGCGKFPAVG